MEQARKDCVWDAGRDRRRGLAGCDECEEWVVGSGQTARQRQRKPGVSGKDGGARRGSVGGRGRVFPRVMETSHLPVRQRHSRD